MSIIHVQQIKAKITSLFHGQIDMIDYVDKSEAERDSGFLTRALAAFAVSATADISPEKAATCVTDGYHDNGIDAIYFDDLEKILYLVQTKWRHEGTGSIERGDAQKFIKGVIDLVNVKFDRFNEKIKSRSLEIESALSLANTRIVLLLAYTGQATLSEEVARDFDDLLREMNDPSDVIELRVLRQVNLHSTIVSGTLGAPINFDLVLRDWGQIREPFLAYFGRISATEVASWWDQHHPRLFAPNIRAFLGTTEINQGIIDTLATEPENFWYFNNGITALCSTIRKKPIGGNTHDSGVFECTDVSIVNGAQTVGAIATANVKFPDKVAKATVLVRFISLESCPDDFSLRVTRATNTQNRIERRDFVSLDPDQERLRTELQLDGIDYVYKAGYSPRDVQNGFDLTEATVALACAHADISHAVQAKRGIGVLWEDVTKSPYKALFNQSVSSIRLWRLVQIHRAIEEELKNQQKKRQGREAMLPVHGNRFLARQVFRHLPLQKFDDPRTTVTPVLDLIPATTEQAIELTISAINQKYPDSYLANLFKNTKKCQDVETLIQKSWGE